MTLGLECIKFMLEQDPDNLPIVQKWIDKWCWRGIRVLSLVGMMMDYMLPKRVMSWKEAWEIYFEQNGGALFNDLARYGIKVPDCVAQCTEDKEHVSHQAGALVHVKASAFGGGNARRVLATVLQHLQPVVQQLVDRRGGNDPENSTHGNFAYLNRILSATTAGSQGLAATTAISSGGENNACVHQGA